MPVDPSADALLLSGAQVCARLFIGPSHLYAMRRAGRLPLTPVRLGRAKFCR